MTAEQVLRTAAEKLRAAQIENASFDASCLVENITGLSRTKIMLCDDDIADEQAELVERAVLRRISGEPLQYILGEWDFFGRTFEVGEGVLVPRHGVYAAKVFLDNGAEHMAVTNVGVRPTVSGSDRVSVESYILDFEGDLYDHTVRVEFHHFIRDERKFSGVDELKAQILRDAETTREYFAKA